MESDGDVRRSFESTKYSVLHEVLTSGDYGRSYVGGLLAGGRKGIDAQREGWASVEVAQLLSTRTYAWYHERPPMDWYAGAMTMLLFCSELPPSFIALLMKALNYFGNYKLAVALFDEAGVVKDEETRFELRKQLAKAHKNAGAFAESRTIYREEIRHLRTTGDLGRIAYVLMLFAKLCNDYEQRQGWYLAYHRIAFRRVNRLVRAGNHMGKRVQRWFEICQESYAKALYNQDYRLSERLYASIIRNHRVRDDALVRIKSHLTEERIKRLASVATAVDGRWWVDDLRGFDEILDLTRSLGNIRAANVRTVQRLKLLRLLRQWHTRCRQGAELDGELALPFEQVQLTLDNTIRSAAMLNDWKTMVLARSELARWLATGATNMMTLYSSEKRLEAVLEQLTEAKNILRSDGKDLLSSMYYDVLLELGEAHKMLKDYKRAVETYDEAYEYCRNLAEKLEDDENELERHRIAGAAEMTGCFQELEVLQPHERSEVRSALSIDYRLMARRVFEIQEKSKIGQEGIISGIDRNAFDRIWRFGFHDVLSRLVTLDHLNTSIGVGIADFKEFMDQWRKELNAQFQVEEMDLAREVYRRVDFLTKLHSLEGRVNKGTSQQIPPATFSRFVLNGLLDVFFGNVVDVASRKGKPQELQIGVILYKVGNTVGLRIQDNMGEFETMNGIVKLLNEGKYDSIPSSKATGGGTGLAGCKRMLVEQMYVSAPWQVTKLDEEKKEFTLPLIVE